MINSKNALIIGAGIGGLTAAIALKQLGYEPVVYERAPEERANGTTLVLWPNALRILEQWNLTDKVISLGVRNESMSVKTATGRLLYELPLHSLENKYGLPVITLLRSDLQRILIERLGMEHINWGHELLTIEQDDQEARAYFTNGHSAKGRFLIGADGVHSTVRPAIAAHVELRDCGYVAFRGMVHRTQSHLPPRQGIEFWGRGKRFGIFHTGNQGIYWFATMNCQRDQNYSSNKEDLSLEFADWNPLVGEILCHTDPSKILRHHIFDLPSLSTLTNGRFALLGDAAHAMTPNLGQGACQAIEDSGMLGECLQHDNNIKAALKQYEIQRLARVRRIVNLSYRMGWVSQWSNPILCSLRNQMFSAIPNRLKLQQLDRFLT